MANSNDYFVSFGSNAKAWADDIVAQSRRAQSSVNSLMEKLNTLNGGAGKNTAIRVALAEDAGRTGRSPTSDPSMRVEGQSMKTAIYEQVDALKNYTDQAGTLLKTMQGVVKSMEALPGRMKGTMNSIQSSLNRHIEIAEGRGRSYNPNQPNRMAAGGSVRYGSDEAYIMAMLRKAQSGNIFGAGTGTRAVGGAPPPSGIKTVGAQAVDRANFDRVVNAIRAQTRIMAAGAPVRIAGGPENLVSRDTAPIAQHPTTAPAQSQAEVVSARNALTRELLSISEEGRQVDLAEAKTLVDRIDTELAKFAGNLAELDAQSAAIRDLFKSSRSSLRSALAKAEQAGGTTRGEQSAANRAAAEAARQARPTITDTELARRREQQAYIDSPAQEDFARRSAGRYTGPQSSYYAKDELEHMAQAYEKLGIAVERNSKTTKAQLGQNLIGARREYESRYPEGAAALQTEGLNIQKTTQISEQLNSILGDLNAKVAERVHALEVINADRTTGGVRQTAAERAAALPGAILVPPGMVKGQRQVGAAIGEHGDSLFTRQDVQDAEEVLRASAKREMPRAIGLARDAGFDPYDPALGRGTGIKAGASTGDAALAQAAADRLRDIRLATEELDKMGQEFLGLGEALTHNQEFIDRTTKILQSLRPADFKHDDAVAANDRELRTQLQGAQDEQNRMAARVQELGAGGRGSLFLSPEYQQGLVKREGSLTGLEPQTGAAQAQGYYLGQERSGADLQARRTALQEEVDAANEAKRTSVERIQALNEQARNGKSVDPEAYAELMNRLELAERNAKSFAEELKVLDGVLHTTEEGVQRVVRAAAGMGTRQAYQASRAASDTAGRTYLSDYRLLRSATGQAVANVGSATGARTIIGQGISSDLGFNEKTGNYYSKSQRLGKEKQDELNIVTNQLSAAQRNYFEALQQGTATQAELDALFHNLENAANKFANRLQSGFGLAPSFTSLTGRNPAEDSLGYPASLGYGSTLSEKTMQDEARRQAARSDAEAERTRKFKPDAAQREARAQNSLILAEERLARVMAERARLEKIAAEQEAQLAGPLTKAAALNATQRAHALGQAQKADEEYARAQVERNKLFQQAATIQDPYHGSTDPTKVRGATVPTAHLPSPERDVLGYDAHLGYNESLNSAIKKAEERVRVAYEKRTAIVEQLVPPSEEAQLAAQLEKDAIEAERKAVAALERWQQESERLAANGSATSPALRDREKTFYDLQEKSYTAQEHAQLAREAVTGRTAGATPERLAALRAQRPALVQQLAAARGEGDLKENAGYHAAREAIQRLDSQIQLMSHQVGDDLVAKFRVTHGELAGLEREAEKLNGQIAAAQKELGLAGKAVARAKGRAGGGTGGGTTPPPATAGEGGGADNNILRQILAELRGIHATLRGPLKISGRVSTSAGGTTRAPGEVPATPTVRAGASQDEIDRAANRRRQLENSASRRASREDRAALAETAAAQRFATKQSEAAAAAMRQQARAESNLASVTSKVTASTKAEISELSRLAKAAETAATEEERLAAQSARAGQQSKVASALNTDLARTGANATERRNLIRTTLNTAGTKISGDEFESVLQSSRVSSGFKQVGAQWGNQLGQGTMGGFQKTFGGGSGFFERILHTTGTFIVRNFAAGFVFGITNELQKAISEAILTQQTFVRLSSTLAATGKDVGNLRTDLQGLSSQYGVSLNDTYDTAAKLAGVFNNSKALLGGVKTVAQLQQISEGAINAQESVGALTSIWAAFGDQLSKQGGAEHVSDVATSLQNLTGVNIEQTIEGVARLSGLAKQMGISFEETATFVAQISKETNTTGATAGEQLSRILQQVQNTTGQTALKNALGQDVFSRNTQNGAINYGNVLKELVGDWNNLSKTQQANLTHALAGTRQAATFNALMDNGAQTLKNLATATNDQGAAAKRMAQLMHTLNGELARFRSNFQNLVTGLSQTGLLDGFGLLLEVINQVLGGIDKLLTLLTDFEANTGVVGHLTKLATSFLGVALAGKVLVSSIRGVKAAAGASGTLSAFGGGFAAPAAGGAAGARLTGALAGGGAAAGEEAGLAAAMKGQTAAMLAQTGAQTRLFALSGQLGRTMQALSTAELEVTQSSVALSAAQAKLLTSTEIRGASEAQVAKLEADVATSQAELSTAIKAHVAAELQAAALVGAYEAEAAALAAHVEATAALTAVEADVMATEEAVAAVNATLAETEAALIAAIRVRIGAEEAASAAAGAGALSSIGSGLKALGPLLVRFLPVLAAIVGDVYLVKGLLHQGDRVDQAAKETGGATPASGATADELRASASNYAKALQKSQDDESKGLFGWGFGPSLTKAITRGVPLGDGRYTGVFGSKYNAADEHQANLAAIETSLKTAATAMDKITKQRLADAVGEHQKAPTFTSLGSDYLATRLQELTDKGQSAAQQLRELNDVLFGTGKAAAQAKGNFYVGGQPTDSLKKWIQTTTPGLLQILSDAGLDVSNGGPDLLGGLGAQRQVRRSYGGLSPTGENLSAPITIPVTQANQTTGNTAEAIRKAQKIVLANAAKQLGIGDGKKPATDAELAKFVRDAAKNGVSVDSALGTVAKYRDIRTKVEAHFQQDLHSYKTLMGEAALTAKDAVKLVGDINDITDAALADLPETDLDGRIKLNRGRVDSIREAILKAAKKGHVPTQLYKDLQTAEDTLVDSKLAEADRTRIAAQSADHSKKNLIAQAKAEARKMVAYAVKHNDPDALANIIQQAGKYGQILAAAAIRNLQEEWDAYVKAKAAMDAFAAAHGVVIGGPTGLRTPKRPGQGPNDIHRLWEAQHIPTTSTATSPWGTGEGVPGLDTAAAQKADAGQLRQDEFALKEARLGVAAAYAEARGDAVAAAKIQVKIAALGIAAAKADLAAAKTQDERLQAQAAIYNAQAQLIAAHAAVAEAETALISSRFDVSIALAEAAGRTVKAAVIRAHQAQAALAAALRKSHGENTAEVNAARASAIAAEASVRDAKLQDELDTIDFNLQMGRITQSSAIQALQHILKTEELTKAQRRQLLLQIKGMKDELSNSQWNFGDIKLPTPYQMRRYIEQRRNQFRNDMDNAAIHSHGVGGAGGGYYDSSSSGAKNAYNDARVTNITIDGADLHQIKKVLKEVIGGSVNVRTTAPRRGNR